MFYDLKRVTTAYVRGFCDFVKKHKIGDENQEDLYDLFMFCLKGIHGLPCCEQNYYIDVYGVECINFLRKVRGVPKKIEKLDTNDRISIVSMCGSYFVAVRVVNAEKMKGLNV